MSADVPVQGRRWLTYALATTLLWGVWGAFTGVSIAGGIPETIVYVIWAAVMVLPMLVILARTGWKLDVRGQSIAMGLAIGLLGAGGQLLLFHAVTTGPAYLIFPVISLSPVVTIILSIALLRERTGLIGWAGIVLALIALPLFDYSPGGVDSASGAGWFVQALLVMAAWGLQAFVMKFANNRMSAESIFVYMTLTALALAPVAWGMTDWSKPVNWDGAPLAAGIQLLNAVGALALVFAFRYGKAIVVAPLTNAGAPLITAIIALVVAGVVPGPYKTAALVLALVAAALLALTAEKEG